MSIRMKKFLLFTAGFLAGIVYIALTFLGGFQISFWSASHGLAGKTPLLLLVYLMVSATVGFYLLSWLFKAKLQAKNSFPLGAFLMGDAILISVPVMKVLSVEHLKKVSGNSETLAKTYAYLILVLVAGVTCLVISWLMKLMIGQFRKFRQMSIALEAQNAALRASLAESQLTANQPQGEAEPSQTPKSEE